MKNKTLPFTFCLLVFFCDILSLSSQTVNKQSEIGENAVLYSLPKTSFIIKITYTGTTFIKGIFSGYTEQFLNYSPEIKENKVHYNIIQTRVEPFIQPDPDHFYYFSPEKGEIKYDYIEKLHEKGLIITSFEQVNLPLLETKQDLSQKEKINYISFESLYKDNVDTSYKKELRDSVWMRVPYYERNYSLKTIEDNAREAANMLIWLNEKLLKSSARLDPEDEYVPDVSEALILSTRQMIEKYQSLFDGYSYTDTFVFSTVVTPEDGKDDYEVCSFSENDGISDNKKNGDKIVLNISSLNQLKKLNKENPDAGINSARIYYRIPETFELIINFEDKMIFNGLLGVYQSGVFISVPMKMLISK